MQRTLQSHVTVIYNMGFRYFVTEGEKMCCLYPKTEIRTLRRKIELSAEVRLKKGQTFLLEKIVDVRTSRDKKVSVSPYRKSRRKVWKQCRKI